jgi:hypothetical protein
MDAKESLLIAQLSRVTIEFLAVLNSERRENPIAQKFLKPLLEKANYNQNNSLINQGTIIRHAYLTIVWLWEQQRAHFIDTIPNCSLADPVAPWLPLADTVILWEQNLDQASPRNLHSWLRHVRNALSHGRVSFDTVDGETLIFADALPNSNQPHTIIRLSPIRLGTVSDLVMRACEERAA